MVHMQEAWVGYAKNKKRIYIKNIRVLPPCPMLSTHPLVDFPPQTRSTSDRNHPWMGSSSMDYAPQSMDGGTPRVACYRSPSSIGSSSSSCPVNSTRTVLAVFQVVPSIKSFNNDWELPIVSLIPSLRRNHFSGKVRSELGRKLLALAKLMFLDLLFKIRRAEMLKG